MTNFQSGGAIFGKKFIASSSTAGGSNFSRSEAQETQNDVLYNIITPHIVQSMSLDS